MTMSPYDNLPVGKNQKNGESNKYQEVTFEPLKASGSSKVTDDAVPQSSTANERDIYETLLQEKHRNINTGMEKAQSKGPGAAAGVQSMQAAAGEVSVNRRQSMTEAANRSLNSDADAKNIPSPAHEYVSESGEPVDHSKSAADPGEKLHYVDVPVEDSGQSEPEEVSGRADNTAANTAREHVEISLPDVPEAVDAAPQAQYKNEKSADAAKTHNTRRTPPAKTSPKASAPHESCDFTKKTTLPDPAPRYSNLSLNNVWGMGEYLLPFEESLLVPDTMPDMASILFAEGSICLSQPAKCAYEKNDSVSGEITVYAVYRPATSSAAPVDVVKSSVSFKTDKCWDGCEGDSFRVSLSLASISAEMLNERKFTVKGTVCIRFTEIARRQLRVFEGTGDNSLMKLESAVRATDLVSETSETTEISQEINIHEDQPAPLKILKEIFSIVETHKQITSGKLVINGTILCSILYLGEDDGERKLCSMNNKIDFTQFIVMDSDVDVGLVDVSFVNDGLRAEIETQNQFMIRGRVIANVCCYENRDITMVSDAYHKKEEVSFDISEQVLSSLAGTVSGEISAREVVNVDEAAKKPEALICGSCQITEITGRGERGRIVIEGAAAVKILALDEEEIPFVISSSIPLRGSLEMADASENLMVSVNAALKEFWFDSINSRQMEINAGVYLNVWAMTRESFSTVENLRFVKTDTPPKHIPIAVYIVGSDDTLWDIAKRYKDDPENLALLNDLDAGMPLEDGMKLFIMK